MSELPETTVTTRKSSDARYEEYFGALPLQATLNSLLAYRPGEPRADRSAQYTRWRALDKNMELIYMSLLESSQQLDAIDLSAIDDDTLKLVSDYLWSIDEMKKFQSLRKVGGEVVDITSRLPA